MKCVITDYMGDDAEPELSTLRQAGMTVVVSPSKTVSDWIEEAQDADAIVCRHARLDAGTIDRLPACRLIARYGAGTDNVDLDAAARRGIRVTNNPGFCADEVAEHATAMFLAVERRIGWYDRHVRAGGWNPAQSPPLRRLSELTAAIVGLGAIGRAVAGRIRPLVGEVRGYDPYQQGQVTDGVGMPVDLEPSLEDLVGAADAVFLHVPLVADTRHLVDAGLLGRFRPGATLVNCARGAVCDENAVLAALNSGRLGGAAFDTRCEEPPPSNDQLRDHPAVLTTPHVAYRSTTSLAAAKQGCIDEVLRLQRGDEPGTPVVRTCSTVGT